MGLREGKDRERAVVFEPLSPEEIDALLLSLKVATWSVLFGLPLALLVAWVLARCRFPGRILLDAIVHIPLVVPPVVVGYALLLLFGRQGPLGAFFLETFGFTFAFTWQGAVLAAAIMAFPLSVRSIRLSFEAIDPGLEEAAATLGASRLDIFFSITLPLLSPGLLAGALLSFARALGEFGATITFVSNIPGQTQTLPMALYSFAQTPGGEVQAGRLALLSLLLAIAAILASEILARLIKRRIERSDHA